MFWKSSLLIVVLILGKCQWDKARYAYNYFPPEVDIVESLASKAWHFGRRGCTLAVVRFSEANKHQLLTNGLESLAPRHRERPQPKWREAKYWSETPVSPGKDDAYEDCKTILRQSVAAEIDLILERPGSWAYRSWRGVTIVSPENRLAAAFRYGD